MNSFSINKVTLLGRLGKDPERKSENGPAKLDLVTSVSWKNKESGEWQEKSTWHNNIEVWNKTADYVMNNLHQGDVIHIEGEMAKSSWENDQGEKRSSYFVKANQINLVERNTKNQEPDQDAVYAPETKQAAPKKTNATNTNKNKAPLVDDDVPF